MKNQRGKMLIFNWESPDEGLEPATLRLTV